MRISPMLQPKISKTETKAKSQMLNLGKVIEGQVVAIDGKLATLLVDGKQLAVQLPENYQGQVGDGLTFEVLDVVDQTVIGAFVDGAEGEVGLSFEKLGIAKPTELDRQVVTLMKESNIPMERSTFEELKTALKDLNLASKLSPILLVEGETLKESVVRTLKDMQPQGSNLEATEAVTKQVNQEGKVNPETGLLEQRVDVAQNQTTVEGKALTKQEHTVSETIVVEGQEKEALDPNVKTNELEVKDSAPLMKKVTVSVDPKHLAIVVKEKLPIILDKLMTLDQVFKGEKLLGKHVESLVSNQKTLAEASIDLKDILLAIQQGDSKSIDVMKEQLQVLKTDLAQELLPFVERAEGDLAMVQDVLQVTNDVNADVFYMDLPVLFRDEVESLTLMAKKKRGKLNKDDMRLYLALDTINYRKVRVVIDYAKDRVAVNFRLEHEEAYEAFDEITEDLQMRIEAFEDGKVIQVSVAYYDDTLAIDDSNPLVEDYHQIDMKV